MLPIWIPSIKSPNNNPLEIDRAHRARKARPTLQDGTQLLFFADYSPGMTQERQEYKEIRTKLRQKGIDSFIIYPAILKVNNKGTRMSFNSAEEAREALKSTVDMREDPGH
ncbi:hypothetical protein KUCAC02_010207 [Chaenocephalus aceratus]|uniref:Uncharacterized protein n=1 Tax=Chaenocephalus aceratus TaxID=36190 RepID=A0ACB9VYC2_CHAAC|nr:hypothetical protein KUCAC02_010207 [Chaenocephalus aceratus]